MHFFQALILALWFSYRKKPQLWKVFMIVWCFGVGFFDKFNFVWFLLAFIVGIVLCYPESLLSLWSSLPRFTRWLAIIVILVGVGAIVHNFASSTLQTSQASYRRPRSEMESAPEHVIRPSSGCIYLWKREWDNSPCF